MVEEEETWDRDKMYLDQIQAEAYLSIHYSILQRHPAVQRGSYRAFHPLLPKLRPAHLPDYRAHLHHVLKSRSLAGALYPCHSMKSSVLREERVLSLLSSC